MKRTEARLPRFVSYSYRARKITRTHVHAVMVEEKKSIVNRFESVVEARSVVITCTRHRGISVVNYRKNDWQKRRD